MKPVTWMLLLLFALLIWALWPTGGVTDPGRDAHIDSATAVFHADSVALALADTALARAARDSSVKRLRDSAAALGRRLDALDRKVARLHDSLSNAHIPIALNDSSDVSCEARYAGRLEQISLLGQALDNCQARSDTLQRTLILVKDTLQLSLGYMRAGDSLLRWERDRPRPCRVNLLITHAKCGPLFIGTFILGGIVGFAAH